MALQKRSGDLECPFEQPRQCAVSFFARRALNTLQSKHFYKVHSAQEVSLNPSVTVAVGLARMHVECNGAAARIPEFPLSQALSAFYKMKDHGYEEARVAVAKQVALSVKLRAMAREILDTPETFYLCMTSAHEEAGFSEQQHQPHPAVPVTLFTLLQHDLAKRSKDE
jgi:hypothetical protein